MYTFNDFIQPILQFTVDFTSQVLRTFGESFAHKLIKEYNSYVKEKIVSKNHQHIHLLKKLIALKEKNNDEQPLLNFDFLNEYVKSIIMNESELSAQYKNALDKFYKNFRLNIRNNIKNTIPFKETLENDLKEFLKVTFNNANVDNNFIKEYITQICGKQFLNIEDKNGKAALKNLIDSHILYKAFLLVIVFFISKYALNLINNVFTQIYGKVSEIENLQPLLQKLENFYDHTSNYGLQYFFKLMPYLSSILTQFYSSYHSNLSNSSNALTAKDIKDEEIIEKLSYAIATEAFAYTMFLHYNLKDHTIYTKYKLESQIREHLIRVAENFNEQKKTLSLVYDSIPEYSSMVFSNIFNEFFITHHNYSGNKQYSTICLRNSTNFVKHLEIPEGSYNKINDLNFFCFAISKKGKFRTIISNNNPKYEGKAVFSFRELDKLVMSNPPKATILYPF
ncbi:MAG: hypothetical protein J0H68_04030 [Sphingobacteriia bacterium]|nr:hypothetical protein [Sphingobacteriia bacterium]